MEIFEWVGDTSPAQQVQALVASGFSRLSAITRVAQSPMLKKWTGDVDNGTFFVGSGLRILKKVAFTVNVGYQREGCITGG